MFGPIMLFKAGELEIELAPMRRDDMTSFVEDGGMQNYRVTRYLGRQIAPTEQCEFEWFDKQRGDKSSVCWGIYVVEGGERKLIGNTSLNHINREVMSYAVSGFMIFRPEYWGRGIATACHKARTWYACTQLNVVQIRSAAFSLNVGSRRALERVGYVPIFSERNVGFVDGQYVDSVSFSLINPIDIHWNTWWHGDTIPAEFLSARSRTLDALQWVSTEVTFG